MFNMFSGGAVERMAIFALNIMPYISAIDHHAAPDIGRQTPISKQLKKEGEQGRKQINQYTRYLHRRVLAAHSRHMALQSVSRASRSSGGALPIPDAGAGSSGLTTVITLVGGTMFLMWLGEQITARGVGNGISLIIFAGIVANAARTRSPARSSSRPNRQALDPRLFMRCCCCWCLRSR